MIFHSNVRFSTEIRSVTHGNLTKTRRSKFTRDLLEYTPSSKKNILQNCTQRIPKVKQNAFHLSKYWIPSISIFGSRTVIRCRSKQQASCFRKSTHVGCWNIPITRSLVQKPRKKVSFLDPRNSMLFFLIFLESTSLQLNPQFWVIQSRFLLLKSHAVCIKTSHVVWL